MRSLKAGIIGIKTITTDKTRGRARQFGHVIWAGILNLTLAHERTLRAAIRQHNDRRTSAEVGAQRCTTIEQMSFLVFTQNTENTVATTIAIIDVVHVQRVRTYPLNGRANADGAAIYQRLVPHPEIARDRIIY